ncbi:MAG: LuxR C-terminal-related transcriptional regulator [Longimicrobiales bacterium]|nr:LuxR C-terminal-related transcriptional regulator [Longimicrobiales bacterium]
MSSSEQDESGDLERGRTAFSRRAWAQAYEALSRADRDEDLDAEDLERLATAAYLLGRDDEFVRLSDRAHQAFLAADDVPRAARCAFWSGMTLLFRGETGPASGWLARAGRLVEPLDCVEKGFLLLPVSEKRLRADDCDGALEVARQAADLGTRFDDADLIACARHIEGRALIRRGEVDDGLALLDETMVAVTSGALSPMVTGLVYCSVIDACREAWEIGRARAWTSALGQWCDLQPEMVAFTATCLVNRAEVLRLQGAWPDALEEARRACRRSERHDRRPPAAALYEQGEVHRLRGDFEEAEAAYREASRLGREPQPGLALLRLAQGRLDAARAAIRRVLDSTIHGLPRAALLAAYVDILVADGDLEEADRASDELESVSGSFDAVALHAMATQARGTVLLARGEARQALGVLREARTSWDRAAVPYAQARVRWLMARACRTLGDEEGCRLELAAARATFEELGARPDLAKIDALERRDDRPHGLTPRELEVLREVATGKTTRAIAADLYVSQRTIERHLSNIFTKLGVRTRTAATAYAYEHGLV